MSKNGVAEHEEIATAIERVEERHEAAQQQTIRQQRESLRLQEQRAFELDYFEVCLRHGWCMVPRVTSVNGGPFEWKVTTVPVPQEAEEGLLAEMTKQLNLLRQDGATGP